MSHLNYFVWSSNIIISPFFCFLLAREPQKGLRCRITASSGSASCVASFLHAGQSIHAPHDRWGGEEGKKVLKLNIPLAVIGSICSARTDCGILLPCWSAVYLSSLPLAFSHYCNMALSISLSVRAARRQRWVVCAYIPVPTSLAQAYDHSSWIKHYAMPMWPPVPTQAGKWEDKHARYSSKIGHLLSKWIT